MVSAMESSVIMQDIFHKSNYNANVFRNEFAGVFSCCKNLRRVDNRLNVEITVSA